MVSINGLPPPGLSGTRKASKASKTGKKQAARATQSSAEMHEPTPVADAVSRSIYAVKDAENFQSNLQYDLPEGKSRKALEQYFGVMNQARREELAQLLGVDIYI